MQTEMIRDALTAPIGDDMAIPTLLQTIRTLLQLLDDGRIQVWVCEAGRYGEGLDGCDMETDRCGWRPWDEAVLHS